MYITLIVKKDTYKVRYKDADAAEYDEDEIKTMLHKPDKNNIRAALTATRYERAEAEYAKIKSRYNPPLQFTAGFAKTIDRIYRNERIFYTVSRLQIRKRRH